MLATHKKGKMMCLLAMPSIVCIEIRFRDETTNQQILEKHNRLVIDRMKMQDKGWQRVDC